MIPEIVGSSPISHLISRVKSDVYLEEVPGKAFNSCLFDDPEEIKKEIKYLSQFSCDNISIADPDE